MLDAAEMAGGEFHRVPAFEDCPGDVRSQESEGQDAADLGGIGSGDGCQVGDGPCCPIGELLKEVMGLSDQANETRIRIGCGLGICGEDKLCLHAPPA